MKDDKTYYYLDAQSFNYDCEPMCALDPLLLIPRIEYLPAVFQLVKKINESYSLVILDLKNFHVINDMYSYDVGDEVISIFLKIVKQQLPPKSYSLRYRHGDEFIFFIPEDLKLTQRLFQMIKDKVENYHFQCLNNDLEKFTVSFRHASYSLTEADTNFRNILAKAENELRIIKEKGSPRTE